MEGSDRVKVERPTPADGDDYTYDLRTGPERTQAQLDDLAFRLRTLEAQYSQEIRTLAERLQQVEYVLDQYAGDHR